MTALTAEQRASLTWKATKDGLSREETEDLIWVIDHRQGGTGVLPKRHFKKLDLAARELQRLLAIERPLWRTAAIDWSLLDGQLQLLIESATEESLSSPTKRGAPVQKWRDDLIALIRDHYPARITARRGGKTRRIETIALVVGFFAGEQDDLVREIRRVLKRAPTASFQMHRP